MRTSVKAIKPRDTRSGEEDTRMERFEFLVKREENSQVLDISELQTLLQYFKILKIKKFEL